LPVRWNDDAQKSRERKKVFCASLADVFEDHPKVVDARRRLFDLIEQTPRLDWQLLTKRPENLLTMLPPSWLKKPLENVWLGTTVENQQEAFRRIPLLLKAPAVVRFLSCEPLIESITLDPLLCPYCGDGEQLVDASGTAWCAECEAEASQGHWLDAFADAQTRGISWVIAGGESGPDARPCRLPWLMDVVRECRDRGVPVFVKQIGARPVFGDPLTGEGSVPWPISDRKGAVVGDWPLDLRFQELPER